MLTIFVCIYDTLIDYLKATFFKLLEWCEICKVGTNGRCSIFIFCSQSETASFNRLFANFWYIINSNKK